MANEQHLAELDKGIPSWNRWRKKFIGAPDLSDVDLSGANLQGANFSGVDLSRAYLTDTNLTSVDFTRAHLVDANLIDANLSRSDLKGANLCGANLRRADLKGADLCGASLNSTNLFSTDFSHADLNGADLRDANLSGADLRDANLSSVDLRDANLIGADLKDANLNGADLSYACLLATQVLRSNLTAASLTGARIQDWNISRVTQIDSATCEYIFLGYTFHDDKCHLSDRHPLDSNKVLASCELTKMFQTLANAVELTFHNGIDWEAFAYLFEDINRRLKHSTGRELNLRKYEVFDDGLVSLIIEVPFNVDIERIQNNLSEESVERIRHRGFKSSHAALVRTLAPPRHYTDTDESISMHSESSGSEHEVGIVNFADLVRDSAAQCASPFAQIIRQNADEIALLLSDVREQAQPLMKDQQESVEVGLDDLRRDLMNSSKMIPVRIKQRLMALLVSVGMGADSAIATNIVNTILMLSNRFEIPETELIQLVPDTVRQQLSI